MSKVHLVDYSDSSGDEEYTDVNFSQKTLNSGKKVAIVQPTIQGYVQHEVGNESPNYQAGLSPPPVPFPPVNSPVNDNAQEHQIDQDDLEDVAHILIDFSNELRTNHQQTGDESPVIEITSSPLHDPEEAEIIAAENGELDIIDISSDSDETILYGSTPPSQNVDGFNSSQPESPRFSSQEPNPDMYDQFDDYIISDKSVTTGEKMYTLYKELNKF